jgi:transcription initiation factor TFIID subunit 4
MGRSSEAEKAWRSSESVEVEEAAAPKPTWTCSFLAARTRDLYFSSFLCSSRPGDGREARRRRQRRPRNPVPAPRHGSHHEALRGRRRGARPDTQLLPPVLPFSSSYWGKGRAQWRFLLLLLGVAQDETMHSGADVEAFTAALNREVEGSASTSSSAAAAASSSSQPLDHADGEPPAHYPRRLFPVLEPNSGCPVFPPQQPGVRQSTALLHFRFG